MNILNKIVERTIERVEQNKKSVPLDEMKEKAQRIASAGIISGTNEFPFEYALRGGGGEKRNGTNNEIESSSGCEDKYDISFICEIKKASPSKGIIAEPFPYVQIAAEYEGAGAAAISVLTEPFFFQGDDRYLREISEIVHIPLLRKDFVVDEYMIYEAKLLGADAVLLICAILNGDSLAEYINKTHSIGMSALVETHNEYEIEVALNAGARIVGVNNRDLNTFVTDISVSERLRPLVPDDKIFISENGIHTPADVDRLRSIRADAALVGEALMRSPDKKSVLAALRRTEKV